MQQRLPQQQSSGGADLNGAPRVSFKLTWRYNQVGKNQKKKKKCVVLLPYYYYYYNGIHTGPITFLLLRQSSNQPEKQQTFLSLFFF